jgi:hypothetical protein
MTANVVRAPVALIIGTSSVRLWGLDGAERLARQLRAIGIERVTDDDLESAVSVLLVRGDYLFDERTLRDLAKAPNTVLFADDPSRDPTAAAVQVTGESVPRARAVLAGTTSPHALPGTTVQTPATLSSAYLGALLKSAPPLALPIRADRVTVLERYLFDGSYKGVTDLVTKWIWPTPARWVTRLCVRFGVRPNAVTAVSLALAIWATLLFARGSFGAGLLVAWVMTFLDTVDGKLARVTVTSTRFGHFFDHVIDLVHPPIWYLAWGYGFTGDLARFRELEPVLAAIVGGYVLGRLVEGAFDYFLAGFSVFTWRPIDSYSRLVTARRNPNLLILSVFTLAWLPSAGLIAVACWTVLSTIFLLVRFAQAAYVRTRRGTLSSWLEKVAADLERVPAYARPFVPNGAGAARLVS